MQEAHVEAWEGLVALKIGRLLFEVEANPGADRRRSPVLMLQVLFRGKFGATACKIGGDRSGGINANIWGCQAVIFGSSVDDGPGTDLAVSPRSKSFSAIQILCQSMKKQGKIQILVTMQQLILKIPKNTQVSIT